MTVGASNLSFSGNFVLSGGKLVINNGNALGTGTFTIDGGLISTTGNPASGTNNPMVWAGNFTFDTFNPNSPGYLNLGAGPVSLSGGTRQVTVNTTALTVNGPIGDSGAGYGLTKAGPASMILGGANTYSGPTTVAGGNLQFSQRVALYGADQTKWTPANITVDGGTGTMLALNIGGTGEFTPDDVAVLLDNAHLGGSTATTGLLSGATLAFDTTNNPLPSGNKWPGNSVANGATITAAITNPHGGANVLGVAEIAYTGLPAHFLVLGGGVPNDPPNTYTGMTTVFANILVLNKGGINASSAIHAVGGDITIDSTLNTSGSSSTAVSVMMAPSLIGNLQTDEIPDTAVVHFNASLSVDATGHPLRSGIPGIFVSSPDFGGAMADFSLDGHSETIAGLDAPVPVVGTKAYVPNTELFNVGRYDSLGGSIGSGTLTIDTPSGAYYVAGFRTISDTSGPATIGGLNITKIGAGTQALLPSTWKVNANNHSATTIMGGALQVPFNQNTLGGAADYLRRQRLGAERSKWRRSGKLHRDRLHEQQSAAYARHDEQQRVVAGGWRFRRFRRHGHGNP